MSHPRANSHNALILIAGNVLPLLAALVTAPILARSLSAVGRGELAASVAPLILAAAGLTLGTPEAITYFRARCQAGFWRSMLLAWLLIIPLGIVGTICIMLGASALSGGDAIVRSLIGPAALAVIPALMTHCVRGYARGCQAWVLVAADQALSAIYRVIAIAALAYASLLTVASATIVTAVGLFIGIFVYIPLLWRGRERSAQPSREPVKLKAFVSYSGAIWIGSAAGILLTRLDYLLILPLSSSYALGIYVVAASLADITRVINISVRDIVFSSQSKEIDDISLARACRISNGLTCLFGLALFLTSIPLVPILFGAEFAESVPLLGILMVGVILGSPGSVISAGLTARGRPLLRSMAIVCGVFIDVALVLVLVPVIGAMGAAIASAIAYTVTGMLALMLGRYTFGLRIGNHLLPVRADLTYLKEAIDRFVGRP